MPRLIARTAVAALFLAALFLAIVPGVTPARAQPAQGAPAAFERARETVANRFRDLKLGGDPDRDFAELLIAAHEETMFLAKAQLEYGGDRQLRDAAQRISNESGKLIDELKAWRQRSREAGYKAQPDQPPPGSGPLDRGPAAPSGQAATGAPVAAAPSAPPAAAAPAAPAAAANGPLVSATVEDVNAAGGRITLDHGPIPNLGMEGMTMGFRTSDPAMLAKVKKGDRVRFSADRVNGQLTVTRIEKR